MADSGRSATAGRRLWVTPLVASAIVIGVFVSLVVQILVTLLGAGLGFSTIDLTTTGSGAAAIRWGVGAWASRTPPGDRACTVSAAT